MPDSFDSRDFISADEFELISDDTNHSSSISKKNDHVIKMSDEWTSSTNVLSGGTSLISSTVLEDIWNFPVDNVFFDEDGALQFQDPTIQDQDSSGCSIGDDIISLARLSGDLDLLREFDRVNNFGKIFDVQFRDITHGRYKYGNTKICSIVAQSLGFLSLDKLINDERVRQKRANELNAKYEGTDRESEFPPYNGFLVDELYINEGWINFDQVIHDRLDDAMSYDDEASIALRTKRFKEAKRVLVQYAFTYDSNIPTLGSNNKITDFGVRVIDRTTGQPLTLSNYKNDNQTEYGNSGVATYTGKLEYLTETEIESEVVCNPCSKYKIIKCEGTIYREEQCQTAGHSDLGVSHELAPQFRLNPLIETREKKSDILNTIDPIHWTGGTQDLDETQWKGITKLRDEFGEDNLHVGRLNESRAFHYAEGNFNGGFTVGGFHHEINVDTDVVTYGSRISTEYWDGKDWLLLTDYDLPVSRSSGLAGSSDGKFNIIAFGTRGVHDVDAESSGVLSSFATPSPSFFQTNYQTSKTESMDSELDISWTEAYCNLHTNIPRHSVAGHIDVSKKFVTNDGRLIGTNTKDNCAGTTIKLSDLIKEDVPEGHDIDINVPNDVMTSLSAFARDAASRAAGKAVATNLKLIGPNYNPNDSLLDAKTIPFVQNDNEKVPSPCFSENTKGAMDFIIKKNDGTSDNYSDPLAVETSESTPYGLSPSLVCDTTGSNLANLAGSVGSWEYPIERKDGSIVFVDKTNSVDPNLLRDNQNVDDGDWYEVYNANGIAFNGSTGGLELENIDDADLTDVFEYFHYVKFVQHSSRKKTATSYEPITFTFENGSFCVDQNRKYPIKTVGTKYVGNSAKGIATGGKTSNLIFGCSDNSSSLNIKYGYFSDDRYDEFNNSIVNVSYELSGDSWIRRDNLPENVAFHTGVGDEKHAVFWGGMHASLETPNVSVAFPGCDDWQQAIKSFGGVFNIRGNIGLDGEARYTFFSTRYDDDFGNTYYKANDIRDINGLGVDYSEEYLEENDPQITEPWSNLVNRLYSHVYSTTYVENDQFIVNTYVNGESWIGDDSFSEVITDREGFVHGERTDQIGSWLKEFMDNDEFHKFFGSYRPDLDNNSLNGGNTNVDATGIFPTRFNYFLNGFESKKPVWKYSGHPVEGGMWIWSRPNPGEELFDPRSIHPEPTESGEWQSESFWNKHSFQQHIGYESFFSKWEQEYEDLEDNTTFAQDIIKDSSKFVYWVCDNYDSTGQNTFSTLYEYDAEKIEKFYDQFAGYTDSCVAWQHFLAREAGRVRVRPEDIKYRIEYLSNLDWIPETGVLTITKTGTVPLGQASNRVQFLEKLPEFLHQSYTYDVDVKLSTGSVNDYEIINTDPNGFTFSVTDNIPEASEVYEEFTFTDSSLNDHEGITFKGSDAEACASSLTEGSSGQTFEWTITIDIRVDFLEAYLHGVNRNYNQNHGHPLSALANEFRAYYENQTTSTVNYFEVEHMQFLVDYHAGLGNLPQDKLAPPFISHVPEEGMSTPNGSGVYSVTPYEASVYQDIFTDPDVLPPYDQLVLTDHYPSSPTTTEDWFLARYVLDNLYDSNGDSIQRKVLSYTKTDTENPLPYRYRDIIATDFDEVTHRRISSPKTFKKYIEDFNPNLDAYGLVENEHSRYVKKFYPDSILSTQPGDVYHPILDENDGDRWNSVSKTPIKIYDSDSSTKSVDSPVLVKEGTLSCEIDLATLSTLTGLTSANAFYNINDLTNPTQDDFLFIKSGSNITLYGSNVTDTMDPEYDYFRYNTPSEVLVGPGVYASAQASYPCLTFPAGFDLDSEFRVYHSMFDSNEGGFFGAFIPTVASTTSEVPLIYPGNMAAGGIIWTGSDNPGSIITPQNYNIYTRDTRRKIVFGQSNLIGSTLVLPVDENLGGGNVFVEIDNMYRATNGYIVSDYGRGLSSDRYSPYYDLETSRLQLYRTNHDLINMLSEGNTVDIFGGYFDAFWFNNFTTVNPSDATFINPEPRLRGEPTPAYDQNVANYEDWNYGWNTNTSLGRVSSVINVSGGGSYTGDLEDVPTNYSQDLVVNVSYSTAVEDFINDETTSHSVAITYNGAGTPVVSNSTATGFTVTINDWYPLVKETFTELPSGGGVVKSLVETCRQLEYDILYNFKSEPVGSSQSDPFNQALGEDVENHIIYSGEDVNHEKNRNQYDDNHWPSTIGSKSFSIIPDGVVYDNCDDDISFAYHFGYERAFIDPLAKSAGDNMTVSYDYYRYRFLNEQNDLENWMYVPYSEEEENNIFKLNNFATSEDTPEYMTYSFYVDRVCDGLDQFWYGQDNNQFVERWKFPHSEEVLNNLKVTAKIDGFDKLVTRSGDEYIDIQEYKPFKTGTLSVGEFTFPLITGTQIRNGIENPLKDIIYQIAESTSESVSVSAFNDFYSWLDSNNISGGPVNCYYPLSYDPYAGNSAFLPSMPYFKEENTNFRFDSTKKSSTIRDRSAMWPWSDLLQGDPTRSPTQGDYTWQFTKDGKFWLAEVVSVGERSGDPLDRTITNEIYDGTEVEEVYRIRGYTRKAKLLFDYQITYHNHAGPQFVIEKNIAEDFNVFGTDLKTREIELELFSNRPVNGPEMIDNLNKNEEVWQAIEWNYFQTTVDDKFYRYRNKELCDVIRDGYNVTTIPDNGNMCEITDISQVWVYSIPFTDGESSGTLRDQAFWIEENPLAVSEYITGSPVGYYDSGNDLIENIVTASVSAVSGNPIGSQIVYKKTYDRSDGNVGMRFSRALISGPASRGIGLFNWGKSQGYGGQLLHEGEREYVKYSATDMNNTIPSTDDLFKSWPWNVIGNGGSLGDKAYTDTIDVSGNYWFAFGNIDNLENLATQSSNDVNFKQTYVIGMIAADKVDNFKVSLMQSNYIRTKESMDLLKLGEKNPDYVEFSLLDAQVEGSRLREGIIEVVNSYNGDDIFELFVYLIDENVIDVEASGFEDEAEIAFSDPSPDVALATPLPLPPLDVSESVPEVVQDLVIVSNNDPDCLICSVCDSVNTNYDDLENPTPWVQHNHDDWVAPFLESPFAGPYNDNAFNIWLTAGDTNPWGTQVWSRVVDGKVWSSYRRQRIHVDPVRNKLILMSITGTMAIESFADVTENNLNIPVYCTYDEFLYNLDDYAELDIVKELLADDIALKTFKYGVDCSDDFAVYNPIFVNSEPVSSCSENPSGCLSEGISGTFICPDLTPNEAYTEWATGFVQEYKERVQKAGADQLEKYYFKYNVANTYDSNTFLDPKSITDKEIVEYDWRRYQNGVGCGGAVPLVNIIKSDDIRCINLNECYVGQASFGTPDKAVVFGGFAVPADGQLSQNIWWPRYTSKSVFKWNTSVVSPEDELNNNYRNRTTSPFFSNGDQTLSRMTLGMLMFDIGKEAMVERQGIAQFNEQNEVQVTFLDEIPDFFVNNDKYSIVLQPDQNIKSWWTNKTPTGFTIRVELESWTGSIDWQVLLVDTIPPEEVDGIGDNETFDKWNNL